MAAGPSASCRPHSSSVKAGEFVRKNLPRDSVNWHGSRRRSSIFRIDGPAGRDPIAVPSSHSHLSKRLGTGGHVDHDGRLLLSRQTDGSGADSAMAEDAARDRVDNSNCDGAGTCAHRPGMVSFTKHFSFCP